MKKAKQGFWFFVVFLSLVGCKPYKNIAYFEDLSDSAKISVLKPTYKDLTIEPDDILSVSIQTIDPGANSLFNQSVPSTFVSSNSLATGAASTTPNVNAGTLLVSKDGNIDLPVLGRFHIGGLTTMAAQDSISSKAAQFYKGPTVYIRFANFKITVLGEVARPGTYVMPNEKVTIFDALGLAGDLTIFGRRENVLLIRDSSVQNKLIRLNLNSKDIVKSDYFFLRKNDVIYVEPSKSKLANLDASQNKYYAIAASILSVLIIAGTRLK